MQTKLIELSGTLHEINKGLEGFDSDYHIISFLQNDSQNDSEISPYTLILQVPALNEQSDTD